MTTKEERIKRNVTSKGQANIKVTDDPKESKEVKQKLGFKFNRF